MNVLPGDLAARKRGVVRHANRLNLLYQARQLIEVPVINAYS